MCCFPARATALRDLNHCLSLPTAHTVMPRSTASACPDVPEGVDLPADYTAKQCRRCGVWSLSRAKYDQSRSKESSWGILVAWARGSVTNPLGVHCLTCKKAGPGLCTMFAMDLDTCTTHDTCSNMHPTYVPCTGPHVPYTCPMHRTTCTKNMYQN